jgi:hypothetical protein
VQATQAWRTGRPWDSVVEEALAMAGQDGSGVASQDRPQGDERGKVCVSLHSAS